jgi:hypothetical protein
MSDKSNKMNSEEKIKIDLLTLEQLRASNPDQTHSGDHLPPEFLTDAKEGLIGFESSEQLNAVLKQINHQMHQQLKNKKPHKLHRKIWDLTWTYWTIIILLILTITAFMVIRLYLKK